MGSVPGLSQTEGPVGWSCVRTHLYSNMHRPTFLQQEGWGLPFPAGCQQGSSLATDRPLIPSSLAPPSQGSKITSNPPLESNLPDFLFCTQPVTGSPSAPSQWQLSSLSGPDLQDLINFPVLYTVTPPHPSQMRQEVRGGTSPEISLKHRECASYEQSRIECWPSPVKRWLSSTEPQIVPLKTLIWI